MVLCLQRLHQIMAFVPPKLHCNLAAIKLNTVRYEGQFARRLPALSELVLDEAIDELALPDVFVAKEDNCTRQREILN